VVSPVTSQQSNISANLAAYYLRAAHDVSETNVHFLSCNLFAPVKTVFLSSPIACCGFESAADSSAVCARLIRDCRALATWPCVPRRFAVHISGQRRRRTDAIVQREYAPWRQMSLGLTMCFRLTNTTKEQTSNLTITTVNPDLTLHRRYLTSGTVEQKQR